MAGRGRGCRHKARGRDREACAGAGAGRLHETLLARLGACSELLSRAVVDGSRIGPSKEDPGRDEAPSARAGGSKHRLITGCFRHAACAHAHWRKPQRRYLVLPPAPGRPTGPRHLGRPRRRPPYRATGLRPRKASSAAKGPGHETRPRPTWRPTSIRARYPPADRRACLSPSPLAPPARSSADDARSHSDRNSCAGPPEVSLPDCLDQYVENVK